MRFAVRELNIFSEAVDTLNNQIEISLSKHCNIILSLLGILLVFHSI